MASPEPTANPPTEDIIRRLQESRPPATDRFTYLTIVEEYLSPEILPTLQELLQDVELTSDIGWDLVEKLIVVPGSEGCLELIARLGNPREVILKVLHAMGTIAVEAQSNREVGSKYFVTLCGMLGILHKRLQVRAPSRFLHNTLYTVLRSYDATSPEATAAIISLLQSMSAQKRPPLPTRQSSTLLDSGLHTPDDARSAPDPEADAKESSSTEDPRIVQHLLRSFVTCVIEAYVNVNSLEWAGRVLEYTYPERIVPGKKTMMQAFNEMDELRARDALVGQLVAIANDLGFAKMKFPELKEILEGDVIREPLAIDFEPSKIDEVKMSAGGLLCLVAYWVFAAEVFDANQPRPDMYMFPDHQRLLRHYIGEGDSQATILENPGSMEALVVLAIWIQGQDRIAADGALSDEAKGKFMPYHHLITLISVFHPNVRVRNAATVVAGITLHADPYEDDRLLILEDLLENCMFSSLQACAVAWLREEVVLARKSESAALRFNSPSCFEHIQYTLFPNMTFLEGEPADKLLEFWGDNSPFHLQVANFAVFLFGQDHRDLAPAGMAAAIEHRYVQPLLQATKAMLDALADPSVGTVQQPGMLIMELEVMKDTLERVLQLQ